MSGEQTGEEWTISGEDRPRRTRRSSDGADVLDEAQAGQVAAMAARIAAHYGRPQDIEWAIDTDGRLWLLQARPMTALPEPVTFTAPGPGLWMRNFRLGEWLPEAVTPLFGSWLLPELEAGYLDGMYSCIGVRVSFRWTLVHDWYYTAIPIPSPRLLARVVTQGRGRAVKTLWHALVRVGQDPVAADRAVLAGLYRRWRDEQLPRYRRLVARAEGELPTASPARVAQLVTAIAREAGQYMWFLAIVGGSAWKMEASLARFCREHLPTRSTAWAGCRYCCGACPPPSLPRPSGMRCRAWTGITRSPPSYPRSRPIRRPSPRGIASSPPTVRRPRRPAGQRSARAGGPHSRLCFEVTQRYAAIREEQSRDLTLGWPVLRACAAHLGEHLMRRRILAAADDVHFCTRAEVDAAVAGQATPLDDASAARRVQWEQHRRLPAPVTIGRPPRLVGDVIEKAVRAARTGAPGRGRDRWPSRLGRTRHRPGTPRPRPAGLRRVPRW